jgi:hypothetical protein
MGKLSTIFYSKSGVFRRTHYDPAETHADDWILHNDIVYNDELFHKKRVKTHL